MKSKEIRKSNTPLKYRGVVFVALLSFGVFFLSSHLPAFADEDLGDLLEEQKELEEKEEKYRKLIDLKAKEQQEINSQISGIESQSRKIENDIADNESDIERIKKQTIEIANRIQDEEESLSRSRELLAYIIRAQYKKDETNILSKIFFTTNEDNAFVYKDNVQQTDQKVHEIIRASLAIKDGLAKDEEDLATKKIEIVDLNYQLEERNNALESTKAYKQVLAEETQEESAKYQRRLSKVEKEQLEIQQEISAIELAKIGDFSFKDLPSRDEADLERPVKKPFKISQNYGVTSFSKSAYASGEHNGVDYVAQGDKDILAAADGKVVASGDMGRYGYGRWAAIDHGNGLITMYGHMSSVKAKAGKKVDQGDKIGTMGNTGYSTGPHLHFTVFVSSTFDITKSKKVSGIKIPTGATVNPAIYL